ncbi:MAG: hypothetical protein M3301_06210, partial [Chloroflexota bacterium]|nr:hypothetical protein [Chloroflexota bacterium]
DGRTTRTILVQPTSKQHRDAHVNSGIEARLRDAIDRVDRSRSRSAEEASAFTNHRRTLPVG